MQVIAWSWRWNNPVGSRRQTTAHIGQEVAKDGSFRTACSRSYFWIVLSTGAPRPFGTAPKVD